MVDRGPGLPDRPQHSGQRAGNEMVLSLHRIVADLWIDRRRVSVFYDSSVDNQVVSASTPAE